MLRVNIETRELFLYGVVGETFFDEGFTAGEVIEALAAMPAGRITARINTPGGIVDDGVAIFNALKRHPGGVDTVVDSLAASMGSYLMLAGERRMIARNARVMIHSPWTMAFGNSADLRKTADVLDVYQASQIADYMEASGKTEEEMTAIMQAETWYTAQGAVDNGFATEIGTELGETPVIPAGWFRNTPEALVRPRTKNSTRNTRAKIAAAKARLTI